MLLTIAIVKNSRSPIVVSTCLTTSYGASAKHAGASLFSMLELVNDDWPETRVDALAATPPDDASSSDERSDTRSSARRRAPPPSINATLFAESDVARPHSQ